MFAVGCFYLDDVGAKIGQQHCRHRTRDVSGEVDNSDPVKWHWIRHEKSPSSRVLVYADPFGRKVGTPRFTISDTWRCDCLTFN